MEILWSVMGSIRQIFAWIDSIAFGLIDNAYEIIMKCASAEIFQTDIITEVRNNVYVIIGIFALFRLALLLVNAMINPDKLSEKGNGIGNILVNLVIMFALLIATPIIFNEAMFLQCMVVGSESNMCTRVDGTKVSTNGHYIEKIFNVSGNNSTNDAGKQMRSIAISSLITLNENCNGDCGEAEVEYIRMKEENDFTMPKVAKYIDEKKDGEWVYNYTALVTFAAGIAITYVLFSFAIDIAVRTFELMALQVLAPFFIVTYIDPKSAKSGTFSNWLKAVGKTYASLFIKLAILALMMLMLQFINQLNWDGLASLTLLIGLLIFAKKAPKWIGSIIGVEGGMGELGIGKKLGQAALVGGAISKGLDSAKKFGQKKGKNFVGNRIRNTAARAGAMREAYMQNRQNKKDGIAERTSLWKQGRAAAKNSRNENWGKDTDGFIKAAGAGYMAGRTNLNPSATSLKDKIKANVAVKATKYNDSIGNTGDKIKEREEAAKKMKKAGEMRKETPKLKDGKRDTIVDWQGYNEFKTAIGDKVMTEEQAYRKDLENKAAAEGWTFDRSTGTAMTLDGRSINWKDHKATFTTAGQADVTAFVTKNFQAQSESLKSNVELRVGNDQKIIEYQSQITQLRNQGTPDTDPAVVSLKGQITQLESQNAIINSYNDQIINAVSASEAEFVGSPHKCPTAVQVGDDYVTAIGKFTKAPDGTFSYSKNASASDVRTFSFDPTVINEIMNKVASVAADKNKDAEAEHDKLNPKVN